MPEADSENREGESVAVTHHPVALLGHYGGSEQLFEAVVGGVVGQGSGEAAGQGNQRGQRGGLAGGHFAGGGDLLHFQAQRAGQGKAGATLAMMVESSSRGSEKPKMWMAPLSEKGRPIWPTPQAMESSGTS